METNMNELKTGGAGSDGTIHDIKDYEVVSDKKIIDSKTFIPMQLKTLQEEEKAIIIGGIVMTCGNTFDENGKEMSARLGDYICYVVEQERQKFHTLGLMKGVELVEGVVPEDARTKPKVKYDKEGEIKSYNFVNHSQDKGFNKCREQILSNITKLKQELK